MVVGRVQLLMKTGRQGHVVGLLDVFYISQAKVMGIGVDCVFVYQVVILYLCR